MTRVVKSSLIIDPQFLLYKNNEQVVDVIGSKEPSNVDKGIAFKTICIELMEYKQF